MRARRGAVVGWAVVLAYAALLAITAIAAVHTPDLNRRSSTQDIASQRFAEAWKRSREATYVATGIYERHSDITGATLRSDDVVAQRPPRRLHRQMGGVEGRDDDRLVVCPAPPTDEADRPAPCRLGPPGGASYADSVRQAVDGVRSLTYGPERLYRVREREPGCFDLTLRRADPRAPFGVRASFCFDEATGAVASTSVHHEGGISEALTVTAVRTSVTDDDLEP